VSPIMLDSIHKVDLDLLVSRTRVISFAFVDEGIILM
jgi:hypothetical protein